MKWSTLSLATCGMLLVLNACKKLAEPVVTIPKSGDTYELGAVFPELRTIENDTARIILYPNARWFYLDMRTTGSRYYLTLIQAANEADRQVNVRVFKRSTNQNGEEIAQIY